MERPFLAEDFNYTDGHAYRPWTTSETKIINEASSIFHSATRQRQSDLEEEYVKTFLNLAGQSIDFESHKFLQCTAASLGIEVIANFLRLKNMSLTLVEPCFDNLADIFKRHGINLESISDKNFDNHKFINDIEGIKTDAICLVSPNNPTGMSLSNDNFTKLVKFCHDRKILLIMDFCFRAYLPKELRVDNYKILSDLGGDYFVIEDTGKTWPLAELKAPFVCVSKSIYNEIYSIWTDMILHVSPFVLAMMVRIINNSIDDDLDSVKSVISQNRNALYECLKGTGLTPKEKEYLSVSWIKLEDTTESEIVSLFASRNIHVLPGSYFFWANPIPNNHYVRIALTRDPVQFKTATLIIAELLNNLA